MWSFLPRLTLPDSHAFLVVTAIVFGLSATPTWAQTYYIGVLAPQGEVAAQQRWQPWLDQLNHKLKEDTIVLVPLALENWQQQIEAQQFALVLGPQVQVIKMNTTGWRWLATLQADTSEKPLMNSASIIPERLALTEAPAAFNTATIENTEVKGYEAKKSALKTAEQYQLYKQLEVDAAISEQQKAAALLNEPSAMEQIASALWVAANSDIYELRDLQQRKIVAVDKDAFGGYLLIAHLLQQNGVPPNRYQTQFVGYPIELTLSSLASGAVDAAIAPLCLMEEMARQGKINKSQYRLLHPVETSSSCESSTKIYPNWTLAATERAPARLISQINRHLFASMPQNSDNSNLNSSAPELQWLPPESSVDAERVLYEMNQHPSQKKLGMHIIDWIYAHRLWVAMIAFIIIISTVNYGWMSWLAWRRRLQIASQNRLIRSYDHQLGQSERFAVIGEMSGAIAHEINQPLATIQNYAQGLLIRSQNARADKTSTENALQQIVTETERVAAVITNIRRWAGKPPSNEVCVDIEGTYQQCIELLGERAADISFWYASSYKQLHLPSLLLDQLLMNSIQNAQQQGASHIILHCQQVSYKGVEWLGLFITDDAGGFDEARLRCYSSHYATPSTKADGLGLGLMICQRLCKSIGGSMQLSNVKVQQALRQITSIDTHYQQRLRPRSKTKNQLTRTDSKYPVAQAVGAQVAFYLPIQRIHTDK